MFKRKYFLIIFFVFYGYVFGVRSTNFENFNYSDKNLEFSKQYLEVKTKIFKIKNNRNIFLFKLGFEINKPYHINSASPLDIFLIPTVLKINSQDFDVIKIDYPTGKIRRLKPESDIEISVYEGKNQEIVVRLGSKEEGFNANQSIIINYQLTYQPCTDEICFPPIKLKQLIKFKPNEISLINGNQEKNTTWSSKIIIWMISFSKEINTFGLLFVFFSFFGGFLLNLMPCVLPVVSLKLFSLTQMKKEATQKIRNILMFYLLGIILTFLFLGLMVGVLKSLGENIGWGFQFQNPYYVVFMIILLYLISLSFLGLFELSFAISFRVKNSKTVGLWDQRMQNLFMGVLTVILATPCIAPFLGMVAGFALTQSTWVIIGFYLLISWGFILPYLILLIKPNLIRFLPRSGNWMVWFRELLAFPLLVTVIWLISILEKLTTISSVYTTLFLLLLLTFLIFVRKKLNLKFIKLKYQFLFVITIILISYFFINMVKLDLSKTNNSLNQNSILYQSLEKIDQGWIVFNPEEVDRYLKKGNKVFIHFTADWCLNCKISEKLVLEQAPTKKLFEDYQIIKFKADWTKKNQIIFQAIKKLKRAGIPLDVIYFPTYNNFEKNYYIFNEILTFSELESIISHYE